MKKALSKPKCNCFSFMNGACTALVGMRTCEKCNFYKSADKLEAERKEARRRIESKYGVSYKTFLEAKFGIKK